MDRPRLVLVMAAALLATLLAAGGVPAREPSGVAWLLTLGRLPGGSVPAPAGSRRAIAVAAEGGKARLLTGRFADASDPSPSFDAARFVFVAREREDAPAAIWEMRAAGGGTRLVTDGLGDPREPAYLADGRIVWSDAPPAEPGRSLFACAPDGSGRARLTFGRHRDGRPEALGDGRVRFERRLAGADGAAPPLALTIHPDGTLPSGAAAPVDPVPGEAPAPRVQAPSGFAIAAARPLVPRPAPPALTSVVDPARPTGTLLCLNVRDSRDAAIAALPPGAVAAVRVRGLDGEAPIDLGDAPVHADGSFFLEVPADRPLGLVLLGRDGRPLGELASGLWVRPNENRGCVGCHAPPDRAPENRRPLAVLQPPARIPAISVTSGGAHAPR